MNLYHLHDWPTTEGEAITIQTSLAGLVETSPALASFEFVAGCDIAYHLTEPRLFAAVVVLQASNLTLVEERTVTCEVKFPYIPGLLSFREIPALFTAFTELRQPPNVVMLDGQGIAHQRRFGLACHLGLWLNLPCVGCAKSLAGGRIHRSWPVRWRRGPAYDRRRGGWRGGAVRNWREAGIRAPGHLLDVGSATAVVRATLCGYRHPAPTRAAHMAANRVRSGG